MHMWRSSSAPAAVGPRLAAPPEAHTALLEAVAPLKTWSLARPGASDVAHSPAEAWRPQAQAQGSRGSSSYGICIRRLERLLVQRVKSGEEWG